MLLLMVQTKFDQRRGAFIFRFQMQHHGFIYARSVGMHFVQTRPRHQAARAAIWMRSQLLVIGIEKVFVTLVEGFVSGDVWRQDERFKEPGSVSEVPFGWAAIWH